MGLADRLRQLDNRVLGAPQPVAPDIFATPPDVMARQSLLARYLARDDRYAAKHAPKPLANVFSRVFPVIPLGGLIAVDSINRVISPWFYGAMITVWIAAAALTAVRAIHAYRTAVSRSEAIYGPGWREMTRAERAECWQSYCARWWSWTSAQPPAYVAPPKLDPTNPYAAPQR